jgi:hypothetical protein
MFVADFAARNTNINAPFIREAGGGVNSPQDILRGNEEAAVSGGLFVRRFAGAYAATSL